MLIRFRNSLLVIAIAIVMGDVSLSYATSYRIKDTHFTVRVPGKWAMLDRETFFWFKDLVDTPDAMVGFFYDSEGTDLKVPVVVLMQWQNISNTDLIRFTSRAQEEYRKVGRISDSYLAPEVLSKFYLDPKKSIIAQKLNFHGNIDGLVVNEYYYLGRDNRIMGLIIFSHDSDRYLVSNLVKPVIMNSGFDHGYGYIRKWRVLSNLSIMSIVMYLSATIWLLWFMFFRSRSKKFASLDLIDYESVHYEAYEKLLTENQVDFTVGFLEKCLLEVVTRGNRPDLIILLRDKGANLNHKYLGDITILMCACASQASLDVIELLCREVKDINEADSNGMTALHYAAINKAEIKIVNLLIDNGANLNLTDRSGASPLMLACRDADNPEFVEALLRKGARADELDSAGRNAFSYAMKNKRLRNTPLLSKLTNH